MIIAVALGTVLTMYLNRPAPVPRRLPPVHVPVVHIVSRPIEPEVEVPTRPSEPAPSKIVDQVNRSEAAKPKRLVAHYKMINGLMVIGGDLVVGAPTHSGAPQSGLVELRPLQLWPKSVIPYYIQPDVPDPQRIRQAIAMFQGTAVRFVPYNGEPDAIAFEVGEKDCLSYVGRVGGNQPIWLSAHCGPLEIAHELMHALGFVHEQNRTDRDGYIIVHPEDIEDDEIGNFEKLPKEFMKVSGLSEFDFQSLMIYPPWMYAKNGHSTMEPRIPDKLIQPSTGLSNRDIERINRAYGAR